MPPAHAAPASTDLRHHAGSPITARDRFELSSAELKHLELILKMVEEKVWLRPKAWHSKLLLMTVWLMMGVDVNIHLSN